MRRADDRGAELAREADEQRPDGERVSLIESRRRLVREQELGTRRERPRDCDTTALPRREP